MRVSTSGYVLCLRHTCDRAGSSGLERRIAGARVRLALEHDDHRARRNVQLGELVARLRCLEIVEREAARLSSAPGQAAGAKEAARRPRDESSGDATPPMTTYAVFVGGARPVLERRSGTSVPLRLTDSRYVDMPADRLEHTDACDTRTSHALPWRSPLVATESARLAFDVDHLASSAVDPSVGRAWATPRPRRRRLGGRRPRGPTR